MSPAPSVFFPRFFLHALAAIAALAISTATQSPCVGEEPAARPNILFLFADDMAFDAFGALGGGEVETPNLDRLAAYSTNFRYTYNQGAWHGAVCVASRTMLNTGRFLWHAHKVDNPTGAKAEAAAGRFWSQYMKVAGYDTYMTGKWHVQIDPAEIFDVTADIRPGMPNQTQEGYDRPIEGKPDPWSPSDPKFGGYWKGGRHWSEIVGDHATEFLHRAKDRETPFFMYVAFNAPHDPRQSPKEYVEKYPLEKIAVPQSFLPEYPFKDVMGCPATLRDERLAPFPRTEYAVKVHRREYYAIITHMDAQVGRILDALEASGKARNTVVFFTADHGLACGCHGLMGKQNQYDHSVRVPLFVAGPGVPKGNTVDAPVYLQDVMPTALEVAGVERPDHVEFRSLLPLIEGKAERTHDAIYGAYTPKKQRMITEDGYKLILYPEGQKARLYHVAEDPEELHDLAGSPGSQPVMKRLFARLLSLQKETGDTLDLTAAYADLR